MSTNTTGSASFDDTDSRCDEMHRTIESWIEDLSELVDEAKGSAEFQEWLDVQSRVHDDSYRNALLIKQQCPKATKVAGYRAWQEEFNRHVKEGETAIWIRAPVITKRCPECENSPRYHEDSDCEYDETDPSEWSEGLAGFKPAPVFDVSQTEGEPIPDFDTAARGDGRNLVGTLLEAAESFQLEVNVVTPEEWSHGEAKGVCQQRSPVSMQPLVEVMDRSNDADLATTLIHEYAHARLHFDVEDETERAKREVEAEAVAYIVGRYFGLDTSRSAFYLAAWGSDDSDTVGDRIDRISTVGREFIDAVKANRNVADKN